MEILHYSFSFASSFEKRSLFPFLLPSLLSVNCEWLTTISINSMISVTAVTDSLVN